MTKSSSRTIIDDTDPHVSYSATWTTHGSDLAHKNTVHLTSMAGATATFRFNGTSVEVFGKVEKGSSKATPMSSYTLEDGSSALFKPTETNQDQFNVLFFKKEGLTMGEHVLVVKNLSPNDALWVDYFTVDSDSFGTADPASSLPVGVIVGAALGSLFVTLTLLLLGFFLWTRVRDRRRNIIPAPRASYSPIHVRETSHHTVIRPSMSSYPRPQSSARVSTPQPSRPVTPAVHPTITPYNLSNRDPDPPTWTRPQWSFAHSSTSLQIAGQNSKATNNSTASLPYSARTPGSGNPRPVSFLSGPSSAPVILRSQGESHGTQVFPPPYSTLLGHEGP